MQLTGQNILQLPEVAGYTFAFNNISVSTTGVSAIAFTNTSGTGASFIFSGQNIYLRSSGINKCISSYNLNESFNISGNYVSTGAYSYLDFYIRSMHINTWQELMPNNLYLLNINVATGDTLNIDSQLYSSPINTSLGLSGYYYAFNTATGNISTDTNLWILGSSTTFSQSYQPLLSIDTIIAPVKINQPLSLYLNDLDDSSQDYIVGTQSYLTTNAGNLTVQNSIVRTGNVDSQIYVFQQLNSINNISGLFNGSWDNNQFTYNDFPEYANFNYEYSIMNARGIFTTNQTTLIKLESSVPSNGQPYTGEYITGFNIINSGQYQFVPTISFNSYYYITGLTQSFASMLFSNGCSGNIPIVYNGGGGSNASGTLLTLQVILSNAYQSGNAAYYIATGYNADNLGTNYTGMPSGIYQTGIYTNCFDVPLKSGYNLYSFTPTTLTSGALSPQATSLTGTLLTTTGIFGAVTGYAVTGLDITNIGHGYAASRMPVVTFIRQSGDSLSQNASGLLQMKSTGFYNMTGMWTVYTGWTNGDLFPIVSGLSGVLTNSQRFFSVQLQCSGLDNTSSVVTKLSVLPALGSGIVQYITGTKYYSDDPYFLKKKLNPALLLTPSGGDLSFLTSQSDLDSVYSDFIGSNGGVSIGDGDF